MPDQAWLDTLIEETIDPELPICDPHHHLWVHPGNPYMLNEIVADASTGHNIVSTVFVECASGYRSDGAPEMRPVGETEFVEQVALESIEKKTRPIVAKAIVSHADLTLGDGVRPVLDAHVAASPRFRGIRHASGWHESEAIRNSHSNPPKHLLRDDKFRQGFSVLVDMGLTFDAWFYHSQLEDFIDLAKAFPDAVIILDHFGGPLGIGPYEGRLDEVFDEWRKKIVQLEALSNVHFKLGGINMKVNGFGWHRNAQAPSSDDLIKATGRYYDLCIKTFGPGRCMFESNFPVDKDSVSYNTLWNTFKKMTAHLPDSDRALLFHDTAARVYAID